MKLFIKISKLLFAAIIGLWILLCYCLLALVFYKVIIGEIHPYNAVIGIMYLCSILFITYMYIPIVREEILGEDDVW